MPTNLQRICNDRAKKTGRNYNFAKNGIFEIALLDKVGYDKNIDYA